MAKSNQFADLLNKHPPGPAASPITGRGKPAIARQPLA